METRPAACCVLWYFLTGLFHLVGAHSTHQPPLLDAIVLILAEL
jgi:hypothetical protein